MRAEFHEAHRLKKLLMTPLSEVDRTVVRERIDQIYASINRQGRDLGPAKEKPQPASLYSFDRPAPQPRSVPGTTASEAKLPATDLPPTTPRPAEVKPGPGAEPPLPALTVGEIERRSKLLADIADRITLLRAVWATTLSFEVARETDAWLSKLQQLAATMPKDVVENALGRHVGLLTSPVQPISKPQISEKVQERVLPPSAPNSKYADVLSEIWWYSFAPERPREPLRPAGYVPDGLQSWVS